MLSSNAVIRVLVLFSVCLSPVAFARAQSTTATLSGTVTDERGAVVPGADVTVSNATIGLQRQVTTGSDGHFTIPLLPASTYTVSVERQGFAPAEIKDVALNANLERSLRIELKVGQISGERVTVNLDTSAIKENSAVSTTVDREFVSNLPLNGRSIQTLIALAPAWWQFPSRKTEAARDNSVSMDSVPTPTT